MQYSPTHPQGNSQGIAPGQTDPLPRQKTKKTKKNPNNNNNKKNLIKQGTKK
jgi:hypothetical protein